jgi:hypothetical protein
MTSMTYMDGGSVIAFHHRDPAERIDEALRDFCATHKVPDRQMHDAIKFAMSHRESGRSTGAAIEFGKNHVRLWLAMNRPQPPQAA